MVAQHTCKTLYHCPCAIGRRRQYRLCLQSTAPVLVVDTDVAWQVSLHDLPRFDELVSGHKVQTDDVGLINWIDR